jgi:hypothetical protein
MVFTRWSHYVWHTIHFMTLQYENEVHHNIARSETYNTIVTFINNLHNLMNCSKCKNKYIDYVKNQPIESATNLFEWSVALHNHVNESLNREIWDVEKARQHYTSYFI